MAQLKESELKKQIKEKAFVPLYFLYGEEKYLISHYTEAIVNKVLGKNATAILIFKPLTAARLRSMKSRMQLRRFRCLLSVNCVLVKDLNVEALNAGELAKLYQLLEELSETTVLIISQSTLEIDAKRSDEMERVYCDSGKKVDGGPYWKKRGENRFKRSS